jgi:hypothetical protein
MLYAILRSAHVEEDRMNKLQGLWLKYSTAQNLKVAYLLLALVALAVAGGAPGAGSGTGGAGGLSFP